MGCCRRINAAEIIGDSELLDLINISICTQAHYDDLDVYEVGGSEDL
jgi:hypothetical protein